MTDCQKIKNRIDATPELEQYEDILIYSWDNFDEHAEWVATAPVAEIIDWAETVK